MSVLLAGLVGVCTLVTLGAGTASSSPSGVLFGADAGRRPKESASTALQRYERDIERKLDVVRVFLRWNSPFPDAYHLQLRESRQPMVLSVKSRLTDGSAVPYAEIADAQPGSQRYSEIVAWADRIRDYGAPMYFIYNHEPEASSSLPMGEDHQFVAAWRRLHQVFTERGVTNVTWLWTMTDYAFTVGSQARNYAPHWYPGDAYVDALGADSYNWYTCRTGTNTPWKSLEQTITAFRDFGARHPDKELWLPEFGSTEDPAMPGRKAAWYAEAQALFKRPDFAQFAGVVAFDYQGPDACTWFYDSSPTALQAYRSWAQDPFYGGPLPAPPVSDAPDLTTPVPVAPTVADPTGTVSSPVSSDEPGTVTTEPTVQPVEPTTTITSSPTATSTSEFPPASAESTAATPTPPSDLTGSDTATPTATATATSTPVPPEGDLPTSEAASATSAASPTSSATATAPDAATPAPPEGDLPTSEAASATSAASATPTAAATAAETTTATATATATAPQPVEPTTTISTTAVPTASATATEQPTPSPATPTATTTATTTAPALPQPVEPTTTISTSAVPTASATATEQPTPSPATPTATTTATTTAPALPQPVEPTTTITPIATPRVSVVGAAGSNGNRTAHPVTIPASVRAGDALLLHWAGASTSGSVTPPTGWTQVASTDINGMRGRIWLRTATAADAGATVSVRTSSKVQSDVGVAVYRGTADSPVEAWKVASETTTRTTHVAPAVVPSRAGSWVVAYWADKSASNTSLSVPAGLVGRRSSTGSGNGHVTALLADTAAAVAAGTPAGPFTSVGKAASSRALMYTLVLRPTT